MTKTRPCGPWWMPRGPRRNKQVIADARDELERAARSNEAAARTQVLAFAMAGRLREHRMENHFSQRLEELFKESRA